jgi:hypothetical protein
MDYVVGTFGGTDASTKALAHSCTGNSDGVRNVALRAIAAAVEERPIARYRYEYRPNAVIRYPDDAAVLRHSPVLAFNDALLPST